MKTLMRNKKRNERTLLNVLMGMSGLLLRL